MDLWPRSLSPASLMGPGTQQRSEHLAMVWRYFQQKDRTSVEARQGYLDRPVLVVLTVSLALAALVFVVLYAVYLR
jgi:hypothetical protein